MLPLRKHARLPSVAYSLALQDRLKTSEILIDRLRIASEEDRLRILDEHFSSNMSYKTKRATTIEEHQRESPQSEISAEDEVTELLNETSVGEDSRICFYGRTSLYHLQPEKSALSYSQSGSMPGSIMVFSNDLASWKTAQKQDSASLSAASPAFSASAQTDVASIVGSDISQELFNELLEVYWCWPHHLHLVLCRKIFMRECD